ncbi:retrovirus-related pol polyprotein from transposon TNT 1-94 [Tanacetum coccineum]
MVMASKTFSSQLSIHQLAFSKKDVVIGLPKLKYVKNQLCSSCEVGKAKQCSFNSKIVPSSKGRLNLLHMDLCGPMRLPSINWEEIYVCKAFSYAYGGILHSVQEDIRVYNKRTRLIVESIHLRFDEIKEMFEKSIANYDFRHRSSKTTKGDTPPTTNIHPTSEPSTPTNVHAEENNDNQAEFTNPNSSQAKVSARKRLMISKNLCFPVARLDDYPKVSGFDLTAFSDADHAGCVDTCKSTSRGIQFLGDKLISWMSKKQNYTAMSSAEAKYVALSASCAQVMWMRTQLQDYGFNYNKISLYCESQSAIAISCNPVQHSRTKHIHTRYHFIKEH